MNIIQCMLAEIEEATTMVEISGSEANPNDIRGIAAITLHGLGSVCCAADSLALKNKVLRARRYLVAQILSHCAKAQWEKSPAKRSSSVI